MSRPKVLARICTALRVDPLDTARQRAVAARLAGPVRHVVPARCRQEKPQLARQFEGFLGAQGADVIKVGEPGEIPGAILSYLRDCAVPLAVRKGSDPYLAALPWTTAPGLAVQSGAARPSDTAGLSRAVAGVAETGTLVLASDPHNPATLALMPETHLVVVDSETIVGSYEEAQRRLEAELGPGVLPRMLNFISGPSRTGDIGGRLVMGAHGPRRLAVLIVATE